MTAISRLIEAGERCQKLGPCSCRIVVEDEKGVKIEMEIRVKRAFGAVYAKQAVVPWEQIILLHFNPLTYWQDAIRQELIGLIEGYESANQNREHTPNNGHYVRDIAIPSNRL